MKKTLQQSLLLAACLLASIPASAYDFVKDGIYYMVTYYSVDDDPGKFTCAVVNDNSGNGNSYSGDVTIPAKVENDGISYSVTSIGGGAFFNCPKLTSVTIPASVTTFNEYAFRGCTGLTSITIPEGVTSIGNFAFAGCTGITSITISAAVTAIGDYAFPLLHKLSLDQRGFRKPKLFIRRRSAVQ